jgi:hypothetical protein
VGDFDAARQFNRECESHAARWAADHPDSGLGWSSLSKSQLFRMRCELFAGDTAAARRAAAEYVATLEECVRRFPSSGEFSLDLMTFLANSELEEFRDIARAGKLADSFSDEARRQLPSGFIAGIVMLRNGRLSEAIERRSREQSHDPIQARAYLALAYLLAGDEATALATMPSDEEWDETLLQQRVMKNQITREFQRARSEAKK